MKRFLALCVLLSLTAPLAAQSAKAKPRPIRLKGVSLKQPVIWGSEAASPDGFALAFGGQDQTSPDGRPHTRIKVDGKWKSIAADLRKANPLQAHHGRAASLAGRVKTICARVRHIYFEGADGEAQADAVKARVAGTLKAARADLASLQADLERLATPDATRLEPYHRLQVMLSLRHAARARKGLDSTAEALAKGGSASAADVKLLWRCHVRLAQAAEALDAEPAPRALSPIVYDARGKLFVMFGGDHLDYLTNDTWVFDPAKKRWRQQQPTSAPPPRANHALTAAGGKITLTGGYTYFNDWWYCAGPYTNLDDGQWVYDVAANAWTSAGRKGVAAGSRIYRKKEFHPDFFLGGAAPDAAAFAKKLEALPANTWVLTKPPQKPKMNRDWGTAVIAPACDVMLRWSGGHSAHGGSDVPMFHFATNRWELPFPVELPLGQTYSNTSYPAGFNLNRRPWVTGHTYKGYAFDPVSKLMVFVGQHREFFLFDPAVGDWVGKADKPGGMVYGGCFYDLLCVATPGGIACWTARGEIFRYDGKARRWKPFKTTGEKLPTSSVDSAGICYDSKRDRLVLFPARYGKGVYDGQVVSVDLKTGRAARLDPAGTGGIKAAPKLFRESCYEPAADLVIVAGTTLPAGADGVRLTPAYDCAANKWVALKLPGPHPAGKGGRNVSLGQMYDAKRGLIWCVDTKGNITVCRVEAKALVRKDL